MKKNFLHQIKSQEGIALLLVMTATALLAFLLATFTFDTKVNKLRVYNQLDQVQARLNAEAGIKFALAKLKLYQSGMNALEKNKDLKEKISPRVLESIITQPFVFPFNTALLKDANLIVKQAVAAFAKSIILDGKLNVTISSISGFLNPNTMRIVPKSDDEKNDPYDTNTDQQEDDKKKKPPHVMVETKLIEALSRAIEQKKETDEAFDVLYSNVEPRLLIKEIKFYVNDADESGANVDPDIENLYTMDRTTPKHAPLTSKSELYLLKGWEDPLIDLIKDQISVHDVTIIPLNEITKAQLEVLFPDITNDQVEEFFKYRDGNKDENVEPHEFKNVNEFKEAIVNQLNIVSSENFDERIKEFENAGIKLGVAGKLFRVVSTGEFGRSTYTITAYVDMPLKPTPPPKKKDPNNPDPNNPNSDPNDPNNNQQNPDQNTQTDPNDPNKKKETPLEFMEPRIVEMITGSDDR